jgi:hypothetical protein
MSDLKKLCNEFLSKDEEDFKNHDFKHAKFLVSIMPDLKEGKVLFSSFQNMIV